MNETVFSKSIPLVNDGKSLFDRFVTGKRWAHIASAPFIYAIIVPAVLLDLFAMIFQWICFPIYGIQKVRRDDFFIFDRHKLTYLKGIEKLNCEYCAYFNGLTGYLREIASRTEEYWCPIKHQKDLPNPPPRYSNFAPFGDADSYQRELEDFKNRRLI